jgi:VIT1/CCC1 family predicted Fe2+/Mn2+ transporter
VLEARVVEQPPWRSSLETLTVGGSAAALAYVVGALLQGVA